MTHSEQLNELAAALVKAQAELTNVKPEKQGHGYNYADLPSIIDKCKPVLTKHGLSVTQFPSSNGKTAITSVLMHSSGQFLSERFEMPELGENKRMNAIQAAGAAITYARRYAYTAILGITADEDIDAHTPESSQTHEKPPQSRPDDLKSQIILKLKKATDNELFTEDEFVQKMTAINSLNDPEKLAKTMDKLTEAIKKRSAEQKEQLAAL